MFTKDTCMNIAIIAVLSILLLVIIRSYLNKENFAETHKTHHTHGKHHVPHHTDPKPKHMHHVHEEKHTGVLTSSVRVRINPNSPATCIQVSQLAVYDEHGNNVALNQPVQYKSIHPAVTNPNISTDGTLESRSFNNIYHDGTCEGNASGEFWMIQFDAPVYVTKVVYYNRQDCCQDRATNLIVELLDTNNNVVASKPLFSSAAMEELFFN